MSDIVAWLENLGLGKYQEVFTENEVDIEVLPKLTEQDLKELAIPLGPRKKLLEAISVLGADDASIAAPQSPPAASQAERRQLTVMFVDLVGSTELSTRLDPEDMRELILTYQNAVAGEIGRFEGHIAKFMGDGILAYFGWPRAQEDAVERAVRTALSVITAVSRLPAPADEPLAARIGIATGLVVVGDLIGEGTAQEEAVVGETPNLAARLQALAQPGAVIISDGSRRLLGDVFKLKVLGPQTLKGFAIPLEVYEVIEEQFAESRYQAQHAGVILPMVGRKHELAQILERWQQAKLGEGQIIVLSGEAGIGKSRILHAVSDALNEEPHYRINYQCSPYHTDSMLYPVIQQLIRVMDFDSSDRVDDKLDKLETLFVKGLTEPPKGVALMASLLGLDGTTRYGKLTLSPQQQRTQTLNALVAYLNSVAQNQPLLLVLEDAHWIDPSTLEFVELALNAIGQSRVLLLLTARPTFEHDFGGYPLITRIMLNRLGRESVIAIVHRLTGGKQVPGAVLDEIIHKTDGVPLFVEELTKTVLESGVLRETDKTYELDGSLPTVVIPSTLHDSLLARLDHLAAAKEIAQLGAVIGREFDHRLLTAVAECSGVQLAKALEQLIEAGLLYKRGSASDTEYSFKHALIRDAAYQSLLRDRRQQLHARIARALEDRFPERVENEPELLARHYSDAGQNEKAVDYWLRSGQYALRRSAHAEAIAQLRQGLAALQTLPETSTRLQKELDFQVALGSALMTTEGFGSVKVGEVYARARQLCQQVEDPGQLFQALRGLGNFYGLIGEMRTAQAIKEQLLSVAHQHQSSELQMIAHRELGSIFFWLGELSSAHTHMEKGLALYEPKAHGPLALHYGFDFGSSMLVQDACTLWCLGFPEQALSRSHQALTLARDLSHPFSIGRALMFSGILHLFRRESQATREQAEATIALSSEQGFAWWLACGKVLRGWALADQGETETGLDLISGGLAAARDTGAIQVTPFMLTAMAEAYRKSGRNEQGLHALTEALAVVDKTEELVWQAEMYRLRGELLLVLSQQQAAETSFLQALDIARGQEAKSLELRSATSLANLWWRQNKKQHAYGLLAPIYNWFTEGFDTADLKDAKALLDELA